MASLVSRNPYTGSVNETFDTWSDEYLAERLNQAGSAYTDRSKTSIQVRSDLFHRLANKLEEDIDRHARLETIEMGRVLTTATQGLHATVALIRWFADNAASILGDEEFSANGTRGILQHDSLGVIYGIAPRNFPYNQLLRAAVPNILAGNVVVYKHASNVPLCAQAIQQLFDDAGFPSGVYTNLCISSSQSEQIIAHPAVQGVNLTGSEAAGSVIGSLAGKYLKRSVLELGGNDAFILLDHKDIDAVIIAATNCRFNNAGQRCNSSKRFIILDKHYDTFLDKRKKYCDGLVVGDPLDEKTYLGPMSSSGLLHDIDRQVQETLSQGGRLITGGKIIDEAKNLYAPTIIADVIPGMTSREEEVFGPVASVYRSHSVDESIARANASAFGLSAVVYGDDAAECLAVAKQLDGGMVFINQPAGSKAHLPFGGIRKSGYGKENGKDGLLAFTNTKAILL